MTAMTPPHVHGNPDYLAKDFNSFRSLMLDHLAHVAPDWTERHAADFGVSLVEALAYVGDYLSYYQDAVSAEAYLATARLRASVLRHARLADYRLNEGSCARVWVQLIPAADGLLIAKGAPVLPRIQGLGVNVSDAAYRAYDGDVFETMHDVVLMRNQGAMPLASGRMPPQEGDTLADLDGVFAGLRRGDVLLLHNVPTGFLHPVRLTAVVAAGAATKIEWHGHDALPPGSPQSGAWVVRGNIVLADHGRTREEKLPPVPATGDYVPVLACPELAYTARYDHAEALERAAVHVFAYDPTETEPALTLFERPKFEHGDMPTPRPTWTARRNILHARPCDRELVAEPSDRAVVQLRFGDGGSGRRPQPDLVYRARFRTGIGARGNIGPGTLAHIVNHSLIIGVSNWLPGKGGSDAETLSHARAAAPLARNVARRCVIADDYQKMVAAFPDVKAVAVGSTWSNGRAVVTIEVKRRDDRRVDGRYIHDIEKYLAPFRLIGHTVNIVQAQ
jgi:hypothetical protein